ncbi:MAG: NAD-dependent epimerase/dehydratase family protein [Chloroflexi bacterium]|nr:NAD-dependent epimerase/dehydratase family protein [Chloroflexota bacterium]
MKPDHPAIAITGANGFIGSHLVSMFREAGYSVVAFSREAQTHLQDGVTRRRFDLEPESGQPDLTGCGVLIHCAYIKHLPKQDTGQLNVLGTRRLYEAAKQAGVKQFIFFSSLSAHDHAISSYGRMKYEIETSLDLKTDLILKPGLVLGSGGLFGNLVHTVSHSWAVPLVDGGRQLLQTIDLEDVGKCVAAAVERGAVGRFTLVADEPLTLRDMVKTIRIQSKRKPLLLSVPYWMVSLGLRLAELLRIPLSVGRENLLGLKQNILWETGDCLREFGVKPIPPIASIQRLMGQTSHGKSIIRK